MKPLSQGVNDLQHESSLGQIQRAIEQLGENIHQILNPQVSIDNTSEDIGTSNIPAHLKQQILTLSSQIGI